MNPSAPAIEAVDIHRSYDGSMALEGLSLEVAAGTICGLIGPDGAGKTTLMRILCGLLHPDGGSARILGHDCATDIRSVKEAIGYMPQRFSLYTDLSVSENIRFFADMFAVPADERLRIEKRLMEFSRLGPFSDRRAGKLSGGMKQKLALSCTLIHTPKVLLLDEPTTGVDPVSRQEFWEILRSLRGDGLALLVSTPYMDEAALCDDVVLMYGGRTIERGAPSDLVGRYPRRLMAIRGEKVAEVLGLLREKGPEEMSVHRFGDHLRFSLEDERQESLVREAVSGMDVRLERVDPGIEDVFVESIRRSKAKGTM